MIWHRDMGTSPLLFHEFARPPDTDSAVLLCCYYEHFGLSRSFVWWRQLWSTLEHGGSLWDELYQESVGSNLAVLFSVM